MKTIGEILEKNDSLLVKLIKKTQNTKKLAFIFQNVLDPSIAKNCEFANLVKTVITVTVKNASWATRLRYAIPDMIKNLRTQPEFKNAKTIRYLITPPVEATKIKKPPIKLSHSNEILLRKTLNKLQKKASQKKASRTVALKTKF